MENIKLIEFLINIYVDTEVCIASADKNNKLLIFRIGKGLNLIFSDKTDKVRFLQHYANKEVRGIKAIDKNKIMIYVH